MKPPLRKLLLTTRVVVLIGRRRQRSRTRQPVEKAEHR
jgi:hypothetical protein